MMNGSRLQVLRLTSYLTPLFFELYTSGFLHLVVPTVEKPPLCLAFLIHQQLSHPRRHTDMRSNTRAYRLFVPIISLARRFPSSTHYPAASLREDDRTYDRQWYCLP